MGKIISEHSEKSGEYYSDIGLYGAIAGPPN